MHFNRSLKQTSEKGRKFTAISALFGVLVMAAACAPTSSNEPNPDSEAVSCGADELLDQVGKPIEDFRAPFGTSARLFRFGDLPDDESDPSRLNISINRENLVTRLWCG